jgi:c-di-GMP-binding flagellar brake protein YcgR
VAIARLIQDICRKQVMTDKNRRTLRNHLIIHLEVIDRATGKTLGYLGDISREGLMLISQNALPLQHVFDIDIQLGDRDPDNGENLLGLDIDLISAQVETRWIRPNLNPQLSCIGCTFQQIAPEHLALIDKIGELLGFGTNVDINRVG